MYDAMGRLTRESGLDATRSYSYDADGNRLTRQVNSSTPVTYTYDRTDQLVKQNDGTHGDQSFTYDAFGDLTTKVETAATASSLAYNALGLTTSYNVGGQSSIAKAYDALGRLTTRTAATTETYRYAGTSVAIVKADTGTPSTSAVSIVDPSGARLSVSAANAASPSWALFDTLGSMAALVSPAAALTASYRFDGYGEPIVDTTRAANPYGFTGALNAGTDTTPLYVLGARLYAPSLGAFSSMDTYAGTSADPLSMNRFLYAGANPTTLVDPTGHDFCTEITPGYYAGCAGSSGDTMSAQQLQQYDADKSDYHAAKKDGPATTPDKPVEPAQPMPTVALPPAEEMASSYAICAIGFTDPAGRLACLQAKLGNAAALYAFTAFDDGRSDNPWWYSPTMSFLTWFVDGMGANNAARAAAAQLEGAMKGSSAAADVADAYSPQSISKTADRAVGADAGARLAGQISMAGKSAEQHADQLGIVIQGGAEAKNVFGQAIVDTILGDPGTVAVKIGPGSNFAGGLVPDLKHQIRWNSGRKGHRHHRGLARSLPVPRRVHVSRIMTMSDARYRFITATDAGRLASIAETAVGRTLAGVRYRTWLEPGAWPHDGYTATSAVHAIDDSIVLVLGDDLVLEVGGVVPGFSWGIDIHVWSDPGPPRQRCELDVGGSAEWQRLLGRTIRRTDVTWRTNDQGEPDTVWALRVSLSDGASVVIALGESVAGQVPTVHPDSLVVIFDSRLAHAYLSRQPV